MLHNTKSPGDLIQSSEHNDDLSGLSTGDYDQDSNSLAIFRAAFGDYVQNGCVWTAAATGLTGKNMSGGVVIIGGKYTVVDPITAETFSANQDIYVFSDNGGTVTITPTTNGGMPPALPEYSLCIAKIVTDATDVTAVYQDGRGSGASIAYNIYPNLNSNTVTATYVIATATSIIPDADITNMYIINALASALTINAPTGSPVDGQELIFRIQDNGTGQTLTWNSIYVPVSCNMPTTTFGGSIYVGARYNANFSTWDVLAVGQR